MASCTRPDGSGGRAKTSITTRKQSVFNYLAQPEETRLELKKFLKSHHMLKRTFYLLQGQYRAQVLSVSKQEKAEHTLALKNDYLDAWDRIAGKTPPKRIQGEVIEPIREEERLALARRVYCDAMKVGAPTRDKDLAVRMLGMLIEKSESVKVELSAEEYFRIREEARRRVADAHGDGNGAGSLPGQSILPHKIRDDKG